MIWLAESCPSLAYSYYSNPTKLLGGLGGLNRTKCYVVEVERPPGHSSFSYAVRKICLSFPFFFFRDSFPCLFTYCYYYYYFGF